MLLEFLFQDIPYREYELAAILCSGSGLKQKTTALASGRHSCKVESSLPTTKRMSKWGAVGEAQATINKIMDFLALLACTGL